MRTPASDPIDDRLRELLAVEQRLQIRVARARDDATARIAAARADAARRLSESDAAMAAAATTEAHADREAHDAALAEASAAHATLMARLTGLGDADIDRLADEVIERLRVELGDGR